MLELVWIFFCRVQKGLSQEGKHEQKQRCQHPPKKKKTCARTDARLKLSRPRYSSLIVFRVRGDGAEHKAQSKAYPAAHNLNDGSVSYLTAPYPTPYPDTRAALVQRSRHRRLFGFISR